MTTKKLLLTMAVIVTVATITVLAAGKYFQSQTPESAEQTSKPAPVSAILVEYKENGFQPKDITIKVGQSITFSNKSQDAIWPASSIHPTHGIYPEFDPKQPIKDSWTFIFNKAGIWRYHDHLKPQITGTITVE